MFNLADLAVAKKNVLEKRSGNAHAAYDEGVKIMELYKIKPSITRLEQASKKFIEAIEYNSEHMPSIIYISYVLYALGNEEMSMKYMLIAERLVPELVPDMVRFKNAIQKSIENKFKIN